EACNYSPGSSTNIINVGAFYYVEEGIGQNKQCIRDAYWFFSRPNSPGMNYGRCVDIIAPGQYVHSANYRTSSDFLSMSGTSMACPHVAGASALLLERYPLDSAFSIENRLK
uniref:S8 family serine peptidase n=1 Tax=Salmonella sp. s51228 TaxID=3159652 RepID=UPI00397FE904